MMAHFFTFADRACRIQFFEEDPIVVTLFVGDETDKRITKGAEMIVAADKITDIDQRTTKYREALALLLGEEKTTAILDRGEFADGLAVLEVLNYVCQIIREHKLKNLAASAR